MRVSAIKEKTACFTGHRKIPTLAKRRIAKRLEETVSEAINSGYRYFGCGGALGFDTLAAQTVLRLREANPEIRLILVLPCMDQARGWDERDIEEYERIKQAADEQNGGTAYTVNYARDHGLKVINTAI